MNSKTSFKRILLTYITVLILPLLMGIVAYTTSYNTVADNYRKNRQALLQQALIHIESNLKIAEAIANGIMFEPRIRSFSQIENPFEGATIYKIIETMNALGNYMISGDVIRDYYVIFENGAVVGRGKAFHFDRFYPGQLEFSGMERDSWVDFLTTGMIRSKLIGNQEIFLDGKREDLLVYVRPLFENINRRSSLVILLNNQNFNGVFKEFPLETGGWVAMVSSEGELISSYAKEEFSLPPLSFYSGDSFPELYTYKGNVYQLNYAFPENQEWFLISAIPRGVVSRDVLRVRNIIGGVILLTLLVGGIYVFIAAKRTFQPVKLLVDDNDSLKAVLEGQTPFLRQAFLGRLIRGEFHQMEEILLYLEQTKMDLAGRKFSIILVHMEGGGAPLSVSIKEQILLRDIIEQKSSGHKIYVRDRDIDGLTVLFVHPGTDSEASSAVIKESIDLWNQVASAGTSALRFWGIGSSVPSLMDISRSYEEAILSLNYARTHNSYTPPVEYSTIPRGEELYDRNINLHTRLTNLVSGGYIQETETFLNELYGQYIENHHPKSLLSRAMTGELLSAVLGLIDGHLIRDDERLTDMRKNLENLSFDTPAECFNGCREAILGLVKVISEQKKSHNRPLIERIKSFLEENYPRKDLNLSVVSEQFGITETYLSHFFKEQSCVNFGTYLRDLRMKMALQLLKDDNLSVNDVVDRVGYGSYATFARVFKQMNGISAGDYRDKHNHN
jgi:two-component system response regulator YesN